MSMSIQSGDKVKYIGKGVPQYTNQFLVVKTVLVNGLILEFPEEDKKRGCTGRLWNLEGRIVNLWI